MQGMENYSRAATERAMKVQEVILRALAKKITWWQAAEIIGISDRSMRRWRQRYEEFGFRGLFDRRFKPTAAYGRSGKLTVKDEASNSPPQATPLYGIGIPAGVPQWAGFPSSPFLTRKGTGSSAGALGYYGTIDPLNLRTKLGAWWTHNGFDLNGAGEIRTAYLNNNDLGFGRDMHCQQQGLSVAWYVTNYGLPNQNPNNANLALAANKKQAGATVSMEYKPIEGQTIPIEVLRVRRRWC